MKYTELLLPERIRLMQESHNIDLVYDLLEKHFPSLTPEEIRDKYKLRGDFIRNRIFISSTDTSAIVDIFNMTIRLGLKYESVSNFELRADLYAFINKVL
jgi:hypothetical protein